MRYLRYVAKCTLNIVEIFADGGSGFSALSVIDWIVGGFIGVLLLAAFVVSYIVFSWWQAILFTIGLAAGICLLCILAELVVKAILKLAQQDNQDMSDQN